MQDAAASEFDDLFAAAMDHRRAGRLAEAEALYRRILATRPENTKAQAGLGVVLLRRGQAGEALALLEGAARTDLEAMEPYARGLIMCGRFEMAEGLLSAHSERLADLEAALRQRWGLSLMSQGKADVAEVQLRRAAALLADDAAALADLAFAELSQSKYREAEQTLQRALAKEPHHFEARLNLGTALKGQGRFEEAEQSYRRALALQPDNPAARRNLAALLSVLERHTEVLALATAWLETGPDALAFSTRGSALYGLGDYEGALQCHQQAVALGGDRYRSLASIALGQAALGRYGEALASLDAAVALRPEESLAPYRRGPIRLMTGDFRGGWTDYEVRWSEETFFMAGAGPVSRELRAQLRLAPTAADLTGRRVLLLGEQGVGDQVMFASMIPDLAAIAREVVCVCDARLLSLFSNSFPGVQFCAPTQTSMSAERSDIVLAMGSLGHAFRDAADRFHGAPFLRSRPESRARWAARLPRHSGGLRVGLSWRGGTPNTRASERSIPLVGLAPLLANRSRRFVSLQYGDPRDEVNAVNGALGADIELFEPADINDFDDLAGLIENLDVVVSVQNAVVHTAGALGKPCLTMLPKVPEWRYMAEGASMPWYESVRLFRQTERGVWGPVIQSVAEALEAMAPQ